MCSAHTRDEVASRIAHFLVTHRKHDGYESPMSVLSHLLPPQAPGAPRLSLKKICLSRPDLFLVREEGETCVVRLVDPTAAAVSASIHRASTLSTPATMKSMAPSALSGSSPYGSLYKDDYDALELRLIAHLLTQSDRKTSLPSLGEYCKGKLGIDMKHRLVKFIDSRPGAFARDLDGRQQVWCILTRKEDVEMYVRERFGAGTDMAGLSAVWESLEHARRDCGSQGHTESQDVKIPDSLGPEFWGEEDFPTLSHQRQS